MIRLERIRTNTAIVSAFRGRTPRNRLIRLMKDVRQAFIDGEEPNPEISSRWSDTKDQLLVETNEKCAYCESSLTVVAFGDVEHFRPKSIYWWLAYVYDNYLASCAICNQKFKGAKFLHTGNRMPAPRVRAASTDNELKELAKTAIPDPLDAAAVSAFEAAHRLEAPLIPNPYIDDPETFFAWSVDEGIKEVRVVPIPGLQSSADILKACEEIFGINRPELKRRRFDRFEIYRLFRDALASLPPGATTRNEIAAFVESMRKPESEYAAMIRYFMAQDGF